jgi:ribosomal protein L7/L12
LHTVNMERLHREVIDLTEDGAAIQKSTEDKILHLAERGNLMAATKLARRIYKLSLTEAKQFVEELLE